ncbi:MAG: AraC family transcriptional regulator [Eubacterium sp.]|nr:AraC family transcriptional regulator [Eubacterium sp.]
MIQLTVNSDLSENVAYNRNDFPAYIKRGTLSDYPDFRAVCHWHTDFEFIYVFDGEMDYSVNDTILTLKSGQGVFINSNCLHYGFSNSRTECHFLCVLLHPDLLTSNTFFRETILDPLTKNTSLSHILLRPSSVWQNRIILELIRMESLPDEKNEALNIIQSFITILSTIINHARQANLQSISDDISSLTAMIGYVQQHYSQKISIASLSSVGGCCKTKCNDLFRTHLKMTPLAYITEYRLDKSAELLLNSNENITEIAFSCGFSGSSYYCETFKRYYGLTPKQYRNAHPLQPLLRK